MFEIPETWQRVFKALTEAPLAWQGPDDLAEALDWDLETTLDHLADLDVAGWLEVWELDEGPTVTFSPLAAGRLGLKLVEEGRDESPRWWPAGDPEPPRPRARNVCNTEKGADLDFVVDPGPGPLDLVLRFDAPGSGPSSKPGTSPAVPRPRLMVGTGQTPWPGPAAILDPVCPVCLGLPLATSAYCIYCDRWGLDHSLDGESTDEPTHRPRAPWRQPSIAAARRAEARLKAGHQKRKEKRAARFAREATARPNPSWKTDADGKRVKAWGPRSTKSAPCSKPS